MIDALKNIRHLIEQSQIVRTVPSFVQIEFFVEATHPNKRKNLHSPTQQSRSFIIKDRKVRKLVVQTFVTRHA